jgi:hypothetical protein
LRLPFDRLLQLLEALLARGEPVGGLSLILDAQSIAKIGGAANERDFRIIAR